MAFSGVKASLVDRHLGASARRPCLMKAQNRTGTAQSLCARPEKSPFAAFVRNPRVRSPAPPPRRRTLGGADARAKRVSLAPTAELLRVPPPSFPAFLRRLAPRGAGSAAAGTALSSAFAHRA